MTPYSKAVHALILYKQNVLCRLLDLQVGKRKSGAFQRKQTDETFSNLFFRKRKGEYAR